MAMQVWTVAKTYEEGRADGLRVAADIARGKVVVDRHIQRDLKCRNPELSEAHGHAADSAELLAQMIESKLAEGER